jgi:hypothetical protein
LQMTSQNVWNMSLSEHFFKVLSLYLAARIQIRIKVKGRIRIRIKVTSRIRILIRIRIKATSRIWIRIRMKVTSMMRIRNTAGYTKFFENSQIRIRTVSTVPYVLNTSAPDPDSNPDPNSDPPDPHLFRPLGSGSIKFGFGSTRSTCF